MGSSPSAILLISPLSMAGLAAVQDHSCPLELYLFRRGSQDKFARFTGLTAEEGAENVGNRLTCACTNSTEITPAYWLDVNGTVLSNNTAHLIYYAPANRQPGTAVNLHIKDKHFNCTDAGTYTCVIGNSRRAALVTPNGVECGPSNVFVTRSPIGPIEHGENLTLTCSAHDPTRSGLIYQWFKDGNVIPGKSLPTLMLSEVGLNNEGVYTCRVSNRVGEGKANDSILVIVAPQFSPTTATVSPTERDQVMLPFLLEGNPPPTIDNITLDGLPVTDTRFTVTATSLTIANITRNDSGVYQITASNVAGSDTFTLTVDVYYPPELIVPSQNVTRNAAQNESFTFDCTPSGGNPAVYSYTFRKGSVVVTKGVSGSVLTINPVVRSDEEMYTCEVTNTVGMATVARTLFVIAPPTMPLNPRVVGLMPFSATLQWDPPSDDGGSFLPLTYTVTFTNTSGSLPFPATTTTSHLLTNLQHSTQYSWSVQAMNEYGTGPPAVDTFRTPDSDVDECAEGTAECDQICVNTQGNYTCDCYHGYDLLAPYDHTCLDVDECTTGNGGCHHNCNNTVGSYHCHCRTGYTLDSDGRSCNDVDECAESIDGCQQSCTDTDGSFVCSCRDGYRLASDERSCDDINECAEDDHVCAHNCHNSVGSHSCSCNAGYRLNPDGRNCDDIDECTENSDGCDQTCINTDGSFQCSCRDGFRLGNDGRSCVDVDECAEDDHVCAHNCHNSVGSHSCSCNAGYRLNPDGRNCDDINECAEGTAGCNQRCVNTPGNYTCACYRGYTLSTANHHICLDVDECTTGNGGCHHNCNNTVGSYHCHCRTGYTLDSDGRSCNDVDECAESIDGCQQSCTDTDGSFVCSCRDGYRLAGDERSCDDINECAEDDHICAHNCHNSVGSHSCSCNAGYRLNPDGRNCDDIDECTENSDGCDQTCINTDGSFQCSCRDGFRLGNDGRSCVDVDECAEDDHVCAHNCHNSVGSHSCSCNAGYRLNPDGRNCDDINECAEGTAGCNQRCVNTPGNYTCACYRGYTLSTANHHICLDVDECTTGNGGCHHNCNNTVGSYHCHCRTGYTLDSDGRSCNVLQVWFGSQNYTVTEGDAVNITFITSSSNYDFDVTITLQSMDGSATVGSDYETGPYTVSFSAGQLSATLMVSTMDDEITEQLEDFRVHVVTTTAGHPGTIEIVPPNAAVVTIVDNDRATSLKVQNANVCFNQAIHLLCKHPDITSEIFSSTRPSWKEDGAVLHIDGGKHRSMTQINKTHTVLELILNRIHFRHTYICFLPLAGGGEQESNPVQVKPQDEPHVPEMVSIIPDVLSARVQWRDDRNLPCFPSHSCNLEYYLYWKLSDGSQEIYNATTTSTVYTITDLLPGTEYALTINAHCRKDPSLTSKNSTVSVFTTKGLEGAVALSASSLTTCYDTPVYLHCHHLDLTSRIEGKHVFGSNFPHWKLNGSVIALDGITYKRHYYYSKTQTVLRIVFNRQEFRDSPYVYTCFFKLFNGSILESNPLEVQINVNYSRHYQFKVRTEHEADMLLDWSSIVACSPYITSKTRFNVTQVPVGDAGPQLELAQSYITQSLTSQVLLFSRATYVLVSLEILEDESAFDVFKLTTTDTPCIGSHFTVICTSSKSFAECGYSTVDWYEDGIHLLTLGLGRYELIHHSTKVASLTFTLSISDNGAILSCGIPLCGFSNNFTIHPQTSPKSPVITAVNSSNTSISLNWSHNRTCFESDPVEYHVQYNTTNTPAIVTEMTANSTGFIPNTAHYVSVTAVINTANGTLRSEPDSVIITTGYPLTQSEDGPHCFGRSLQLTCQHGYTAAYPLVWLMDGIQVEDDGQEFAINDADRTFTILNISRSRYASRRIPFQCCVELETRRLQVCGESYIVDPLEQPRAPAIVYNVSQTSISLSWIISTQCFEAVNFTTDIIWRPSSGGVYAVNVPGNSYDITGLTPGSRYNILMLVTTGDGARSDFISFSVTTVSSIEDLTALRIALACTISAIILLLCSLSCCLVMARKTHLAHSSTCRLVQDPVPDNKQPFRESKVPIAKEETLEEGETTYVVYTE